MIKVIVTNDAEADYANELNSEYNLNAVFELSEEATCNSAINMFVDALKLEHYTDYVITRSIREYLEGKSDEESSDEDE